MYLTDYCVKTMTESAKIVLNTKYSPISTVFKTFITSNKNSYNELMKCSEEVLARNAMLILLCLQVTPVWLQSEKKRFIELLKNRTKSSAYLQQLFSYCFNSNITDKEICKYPKHTTEILQQLFNKKRKKGYKMNFSEEQTIFHPFKPIRLKSLNVKRVYNSNLRPLLVKVHPKNDSDVIDSNLLIVKNGDDLRRDMAVMLIFKLMNCFWAADPMSKELGAIEALVYDVMAIDRSIGVIEYVKKSFPIQELKKHYKKFNERQKARQINTAAGGTIASFVLGIKDRHDDNTLFCDSGNIFQIDFSYMLGDKSTMDTADIAITRDTKRHFGPNGWNAFVDACIRAFCTLRKNHKFLMNFAEVVLMPIYSREKVKNYLERSLMLQLPVDLAVKSLQSMLKKAPSSYRTRFKNVLHHTALAFSKKNEEMSISEHSVAPYKNHCNITHHNF